MLNEDVIPILKGGDDNYGSKYGKHIFVNSLIDFDEEVDEWNNRDILPAMVIKNCYIPIPAEDNGNYVYKKKLY